MREVHVTVHGLSFSVSIEKATACGPNEPLYADTDVLIVQKASKIVVEMKDMATQTDPIPRKHPSTSYSYVSHNGNVLIKKIVYTVLV